MRVRRAVGFKIALAASPAIAGGVLVVLVVTVLTGPLPVAADDVPDGPEATARVAYQAGFRGEALVLAVMVAGPESGYDPAALNLNPPTRSCPNGSRDRGLWQINDCAHPDVSDACAFDSPCAAVAAYRISGGGAVWTPWMAYNAGRHLPYEAVARAAATLASLTASAAVVGVNALPLPRDLLSEAELADRHWDGKLAWDGQVPLGTPVYAIEGGEVTTVTTGDLCGQGLIVRAVTNTALYCHGSQVLVTVGAQVVAGQQVMTSGSTGDRVTGPHLHLEVEVQGRKVCPQQMLLAWYRGIEFSPARATAAC